MFLHKLRPDGLYCLMSGSISQQFTVTCLRNQEVDGYQAEKCKRRRFTEFKDTRALQASKALQVN